MIGESKGRAAAAIMSAATAIFGGLGIAVAQPDVLGGGADPLAGLLTQAGLVLMLWRYIRAEFATHGERLGRVEHRVERVELQTDRRPPWTRDTALESAPSTGEGS